MFILLFPFADSEEHLSLRDAGVKLFRPIALVVIQQHGVAFVYLKLTVGN